jgi:hypothetical protein
MGEKIIKVKDNFRTNPESLVPGGHVVEIFNNDGLRLVYDKIKNPGAYIARITKDQTIKQVYVDGELKFERSDV